MEQAYDVLVIGAGPAGSVAAQRFAERGFKTLLIEKRQEIGAPVRCGEAVGRHTTEQFLPIDERWVRAHISHYAIHSWQGDRVILPPTEPTLIIDRKVFDWEVALMAARAGAHIRTRTQAEGLLIEGDQVVGAKLRSGPKTYDVRARLVIAADGTESQAARWAGLKTVPPMGDFYVGFQYLLGNLGGRLTSHQCEYHIGNCLAPAGYIWVFPKGDDTANVGIVIGADKARAVSARTYLDRFIAQHYPDAVDLGTVAGGIPTTGALKKMVTNGLMAVGDAAHQADPLTAGGIGLGMMGADIAATVGAKALESGDLSAKALSEYEQGWAARFGRMHRALYQLRKMTVRLDDDRLAALVKTASTLPLAEMSLGQVLMSLFIHHPLMLIEAQALITTGLVLK